MKHGCGKAVRPGIKVELQVDSTVLFGIDVPQFDDMALKSGHGRSVFSVDLVAVGVEHVHGERGRGGGLGFEGENAVTVGVIVTTKNGGCHAAYGHACALRQQISEAEVVNVPAGHVVVDVSKTPCRVVHDEANLNVFIDKVRQIDGDGGPSRWVLSRG